MGEPWSWTCLIGKMVAQRTLLVDIWSSTSAAREFASLYFIRLFEEENAQFASIGWDGVRIFLEHGMAKLAFDIMR